MFMFATHNTYPLFMDLYVYLNYGIYNTISMFVLWSICLIYDHNGAMLQYLYVYSAFKMICTFETDLYVNTTITIVGIWSLYLDYDLYSWTTMSIVGLWSLRWTMISMFILYRDLCSYTTISLSIQVLYVFQILCRLKTYFWRSFEGLITLKVFFAKHKSVGLLFLFSAFVLAKDSECKTKVYFFLTESCRRCPLLFVSNYLCITYSSL